MAAVHNSECLHHQGMLDAGGVKGVSENHKKTMQKF